MRDDRTWGEFIRGEWWFHVSRKCRMDYWWPKIAFAMPRKLAYWCFIRVYACIGECGQDYDRVCREWERRSARPSDQWTIK